MAAFVLIVLFWVELQTQVQRMSGIEKLKPYLIGARVATHPIKHRAAFLFEIVSITFRIALVGCCISWSLLLLPPLRNAAVAVVGLLPIGGAYARARVCGCFHMPQFVCKLSLTRTCAFQAFCPCTPVCAC